MKSFSLSIVTLLFLATSSIAADFTINFDWADLKLCTSGQPNTVQNPKFVLSNVPEGTKYIIFRMTDLDVPSYDHGGGKIEYTGQEVIESGAFKYQSPCPPNGSHRYEWKAYAKNKKGMFAKTLGTAKTVKQYPQ